MFPLLARGNPLRVVKHAPTSAAAIKSLTNKDQVLLVFKVWFSMEVLFPFSQRDMHGVSLPAIGLYCSFPVVMKNSP